MSLASPSSTVPPSTGPPQLILLATDFCAPARSALACARQIAQLRSAIISALHVMDLTSAPSDDRPSYSAQRSSAESRLREIRRELRLAGVPESATLVTAGRPARAIRDVAATEGASLLILGVNGSRSRKTSTLGATARALLRRAPCPVIAVPALDARPPANPTSGPPIFLSDTAPASLRAALAAWPTLNGSPPIRVVLPPGGDRRELQPDLPQSFAPARVLRLPGAAPALLDEAAHIRAGLIVLAFRAGGYLDSFATGSFAHSLITAARCPVLSVRC